MNFDSRVTKIDQYENMYGMYVQVEEKVKVQESLYTINEVTLVTRIGGIIGVGKEFLWITILLSGFIVKSLKIFKRNGKFKNKYFRDNSKY